jgi:hypothetical protein
MLKKTFFLQGEKFYFTMGIYSHSIVEGGLEEMS